MDTSPRTLKCLCVITVLFSLPQCGVFSQGTRDPGTSPARYAPVTIPHTESRTLRSEILQQDFDISIRLPWNYHADSTAAYPVLFVTDANRAFPMVANIVDVLTFPKGDVPEIILVGIGYKINDMADWAAWRTRDLTPTNDARVDSGWGRSLSKLTGHLYEVKSGGAPRFLEFIQQELIPFIDANYRTSHQDRALAGYSYGGLFALYTFLTHPTAFTRYYAGSPSLEHDNRVLFKYVDELEASHRRVTAKLFMTVGSLEDSSTILNTKEIAARLQALHFPGLTVESQVIEGEDHRSCMAAAIMRAVRALYKK